MKSTIVAIRGDHGQDLGKLSFMWEHHSTSLGWRTSSDTRWCRTDAGTQWSRTDTGWCRRVDLLLCIFLSSCGGEKIKLKLPHFHVILSGRKNSSLMWRTDTIYLYIDNRERWLNTKPAAGWCWTVVQKYDRNASSCSTIGPFRIPPTNMS